MYKGYVNADYTIQFFHEIGNNGVPSFYWGAYSDEKRQAITTFVEKVRVLMSELGWLAWNALSVEALK